MRQKGEAQFVASPFSCRGAHTKVVIDWPGRGTTPGMRAWFIPIVLCCACANGAEGSNAEESSEATGESGEVTGESGDAAGEAGSTGDGDADASGDSDGDAATDASTDGPEGGTGLLDCTDPMATVIGGGSFAGTAYGFSEVPFARLVLGGTPDAPCLDSLALRVTDGNAQLYVRVQVLDGGGYDIDWMEFQEDGSVTYQAFASDLEALQPTVSLSDVGDVCAVADFSLAAQSIRFLEANSDNTNVYELTGLDLSAGGEWMVDWTGGLCP